MRRQAAPSTALAVAVAFNLGASLWEQGAEGDGSMHHVRRLSSKIVLHSQTAAVMPFY